MFFKSIFIIIEGGGLEPISLYIKQVNCNIGSNTHKKDQKPPFLLIRRSKMKIFGGQKIFLVVCHHIRVERPIFFIMQMDASVDGL